MLKCKNLGKTLVPGTPGEWNGGLMLRRWIGWKSCEFSVKEGPLFMSE